MSSATEEKLRKWEALRDENLRKINETRQQILNQKPPSCQADWFPNNIENNMSHVETRHKIVFNPESIKLKDTPVEYVAHFNDRHSDHVEIVEDDKLVNRTRPYLRKKQGLARFRMKDEDFKKPPDIYKNIKIRPPPVQPIVVVQKSKKNDKPHKKVPNKRAPIQNPVPAKIFHKPQTVKIDNNKNIFPSVPIKDLVLRKQVVHEHQNKGGFNSSPNTIEKQREEREHRRELQIFEILENKIENDASFHSNVSIFSNLVNDTMTSTPSERQGSSRRKLQFIDENVNDIVVSNEEVRGVHTVDKAINCRPMMEFKNIEIQNIIPVVNKNTSEDSEKENNVEIVTESHDSVEESDIEDCKESPMDNPAFMKLSEKEMADRIQRKALKDNVKNILNWEHSAQKRAIKKKKKIKIKKICKKKEDVNVDVFLKSKQEELENQIKFFKKRNSCLNKSMQKHEEEKLKFEKEKKDIKELLEEQQNKLTEEKKRLHREKLIFEKNCKERKNEPRRQEREEINNLMKEIEDLKSSHNEERARWASSQARHRTQIQELTKENIKLKGEIETLKQQTIKKVTFKNSNKIFKTITDKVDSLMPVGNARQGTKYKSLTARVDTNLSKQNLRRTKSVSSVGVQFSHQDVVFVSNCSEPVNCVGDCGDSGTTTDDMSRDHTTDGSEQNEVNGLEFESLITTSSKIGLAELKRRLESLNMVDYETNLQTSQHSKPVENDEEIDGDIIKRYISNGDIQEENIKTGIIKYYYQNDQTWHTTYLDGSELIEFKNGQVDHKFADGSREITYPEGHKRYKYTDGSEKFIYTDGTKKEIKSDGTKISTLVNGDRIYHTKEYTKRVCIDGTMKLVYPDGVQETRFPNGRIRIKDRQGQIIMDSFGLK